jgi:hypothetical protein
VRCSTTPDQADTAAPNITRLKMRPKRIRSVRRGATISRAKKRARVTYRLSEAARVRYVVQRFRPGRKRGGRCVAPRRAKRGARPCRRFVKVRGGAKQRRHEGGRVTVQFRGRVANRRLPKARYRLMLRATDASGNHSKRRYERFRIVR